MAGEATVLEMAFDNVGNANFTPNSTVAVDATNSGNITTAAKLPTAATNQQLLGVAMDRSKLDPSGNPVAGSGVNVRLLGSAKVISGSEASGVIAAGAFVGSSAVQGSVRALTKASAGAQPQPALGIALSSAAAQGDKVFVLLTPGAMF
jgi:hypothetical protein